MKNSKYRQKATSGNYVPGVAFLRFIGHTFSVYYLINNYFIQELKEAGVPLEIKGKTNYKSSKKAVSFHEYPDDAPVKRFRTVPSYKRMCITIMKNDHTAKYMGFARTKAQEEKRRKAIEKYSKIL